jgi:hypothetical protein
MKHQKSPVYTPQPISLIAALPMLMLLPFLFLLPGCNRPDYNWTLNKKTSVNLTGTWTEYWSKVDEHDRYVIDHPKNGEISMSCTSYEYFSFSEIRLSGYDFSFTITNTVDSADLYVLKYSLTLSNDHQTLKGHVRTNKGIRDRVRLVKE